MEEYLMSAFEHFVEILNTYMSHTITFLIVTTITGFVLFFKERKEWKHAHFKSRLNISLNLVSKGKLFIRTVKESDVRSVVLSSYARKLLRDAIKSTSIDDPFVRFSNTQDGWLVYNEILNTISGIYGSHFLTAAINRSYEEEEFLIALTWERDAEIRIQKVRVLVVNRHDLDLISSGLKTETLSHKARIHTLMKMQEQVREGNWPWYQKVALPR